MTIGVPHPETVDKASVWVLPHGTGTVEVVEGGLEIPTEDGSGVTLLAQAAAEVFLDLPGGGRGMSGKTLKRVILEWAAATTSMAATHQAALRAVQDALHHSSLSMLRALQVPPRRDGGRGDDRRAAAGAGGFSTRVAGLPALWQGDREGGEGRARHTRPGKDDPAVVASAAIVVSLPL